MAEAGSRYRTVSLNTNGVVRTLFVPLDEDGAGELDLFGPPKPASTTNLATNTRPVTSIRPATSTRSTTSTRPAILQSATPASSRPQTQQKGIQNRAPSTPQQAPVFSQPLIGNSLPSFPLASPLQSGVQQMFNIRPPVTAAVTARQPVQPVQPVQPPNQQIGSTYLAGLNTFGVQQSGPVLTQVQPLFMSPSMTTTPGQNASTVPQFMFLPQQQVAQRPMIQTVVQVPNNPGLQLIPTGNLGLMGSQPSMQNVIPFAQPQTVHSKPVVQTSGFAVPIIQPGSSNAVPVVQTATPTVVHQPSSVATCVATNSTQSTVISVTPSTDPLFTSHGLPAIAPKPKPSTTTVINVKQVGSDRNPNQAVEAGVQNLLTVLEKQSGMQCAKVLETLQESLKTLHSDGEQVATTTQSDGSTPVAGSKPVQAVGPFHHGDVSQSQLPSTEESGCGKGIPESGEASVEPRKSLRSNTSLASSPAPDSGSLWQTKFAADYTRPAKNKTRRTRDPLANRRQTRQQTNTVDNTVPGTFVPLPDLNPKRRRTALKRQHDEDMKTYCSADIRPFMNLCTVELSKVDLRGKKKAKFSDILSDLYPDIFEK